MKKKGLHDIKQRNRQVIMLTIIEHKSMSRVELARETGLAASTVSGLVSELLDEHLLMEAGSVSTAGRNRTVLALNPDFGTVVVFEIGKKQINMHCFDMLLCRFGSQVLTTVFCSGNDLYTLLRNAIFSVNGEMPKLIGIGLLFQDDMKKSDFNMVYSTGVSYDNITLSDALFSQFRVPVKEQYSLSYTASNALSQTIYDENRNRALIAVGRHIVTDITIAGKSIPVRDSFCDDLAFAMGMTLPTRSTNGAELEKFLSSLIVLLAVQFPLEAIFILGSQIISNESEKNILAKIAAYFSWVQVPAIHFLRSVNSGDSALAMAQKLIKKVLTT